MGGTSDTCEGLNPESLTFPPLTDAEVIAIILNGAANEGGAMFYSSTNSKLGFLISGGGGVEVVTSA